MKKLYALVAVMVLVFLAAVSAQAQETTLLPIVKGNASVAPSGGDTPTPTPTQARMPVPTITVVPRPSDPDVPYYGNGYEQNEIVVTYFNQTSGIMELQSASFRDVWLGGWEVESILYDWNCALPSMYMPREGYYTVSLYGNPNLDADLVCDVRVSPFGDFLLLDHINVVVDWVDQEKCRIRRWDCTNE
jgi:hypothetical protein